ncbi:MAG: hypothetical protein ACLFVP_00865 [Candidatus Bathyarchaeia archaeon]
MVIPIKIFEIRGEMDPEPMYQKLDGYQDILPYEGKEGPGELFTQILYLEREGDVIKGVLSKDFLRERYYHGDMVETPTTEEAPFWIIPRGDRKFLIVSAPSVARGVKKLLTGHVANELSQILFGEHGMIVEGEIPHETLKELHESNPKATNLIWFDNVDIPDVDKLCLSGSGLADTELYQNYLIHGQIWYVVFEVQKHGIVVGITRNCVVALFSKSELEEFIDFAKENILELID